MDYKTTATGGVIFDADRGVFETVEGQAEHGQRLAVRWKTHVGEWILDVDAGIPWVELIAEKPFDLRKFDALLRAEALLDPSIVSIDAFELSGPDESGHVVLVADMVTIDGPAVATFTPFDLSVVITRD